MLIATMYHFGRGLVAGQDSTEGRQMLRRCVVAGLAAAAVMAAANPAPAQTLDKIKKDGVLIVGTKADYKPFGFRDPSGAIIGFEPGLAKEVAGRLHVKVHIEPVLGG